MPEFRGEKFKSLLPARRELNAVIKSKKEMRKLAGVRFRPSKSKESLYYKSSRRGKTTWRHKLTGEWFSPTYRTLLQGFPIDYERLENIFDAVLVTSVAKDTDTTFLAQANRIKWEYADRLLKKIRVAEKRLHRKGKDLSRLDPIERTTLVVRQLFTKRKTKKIIETAEAPDTSDISLPFGKEV